MTIQRLAFPGTPGPAHGRSAACKVGVLWLGWVIITYSFHKHTRPTELSKVLQYRKLTDGTSLHPGSAMTSHLCLTVVYIIRLSWTTLVNLIESYSGSAVLDVNRGGLEAELIFSIQLQSGHRYRKEAKIVCYTNSKTLQCGRSSKYTH
jgi:hypothetical protein